MKILYLISLYDIKDGSSNALYSQIKDPYNPEYKIVCKWLKTAQEEINIIEYSETIICSLLKDGNFDLIHYFKSRSSNILDLVLKKLQHLKLDIPVVTTICQNPSFGPYMLSPFELKHSNHFIFIDKASYNNPIIDFIPENKKSQIYLSQPDIIIKRTEEIIHRVKNKNENIIFGRGSTLSKCPPDMFDIFDAIDIPNKEFHIVGVPLDNNWVHQEAKKRSNVKMWGYLSYEEWFKRCSTFDIFLYQLPEHCHASLDANLGLAMLMRIPVVYYGCDAPKERFEHGANGFIAETKEQIIQYATDLGNNESLRIKIGENGRASTIINFSYKTRIENYQRVYNQVFNSKKFRIQIPYTYWLTYIPKNWRRLIHALTGYYKGPK